ncbi:MAG: amidohydrolase family protein [Proteobacteria bacterium]|nr:amidohydrolase family protein [Pseudomonadota bacterium]
MTRTLIKNGLIIDGTGKDAYQGHLLVENERIVSQAHSESQEGAELTRQGCDYEIDAVGKAVSPGFIDCHSHFDWMFPLSNHQEFLYPLVEQGITTVVTGNCGFSPAPVDKYSKSMIEEYSEFLLEKPLDFKWTDIGDYIAYLNSTDGLLFNNAQQVGHGTIQIASEKSLTSQPGRESLERMIMMTEEAFEQGAHGLSLGLMYPPGLFSKTRDLKTMAKVAANNDRFLSVHNRALSKYSGAYPIIPFFGRPHNLKALDEVLKIALDTGVKTQISHFIFVGRKSWSTADKAISMIERARDKGARVMWDIYPHFCGNSYLVVFLPPWFVEKLDENMENPKAIKKLKFELNMAKLLVGLDLEDIQIMEARYPEGEKYNGLNLGEIGAMEGIEPLDAMLKIVKESDGKALQLTWGYSGDDNNEWLLEKMMQHPLCLFETDTLLISKGFPNPCSYGAFPRILGRFVREKKALTLPDAISKMTGKTASWMGIKERGVLKPGNYADITIFDPHTIADNTTKKKTDRSPSGIETVIINGQLVVNEGEYLKNTKPGLALACS